MPAERLRQMQTIRQWSLSQLTSDDRAFIAGFQPTIEIEIPLAAGRRLLCFHGSPASFDDIILPQTAEEEFQRYLGPYTAYILTGGHTHLQYIRRLDDTFFFNPGSVGLAYDHEQAEDGFRLDPWAEYAVLRVAEARISLEFRRVPFAVPELVRAYRDSGRPYAQKAIAQYRVATKEDEL
jgi:diadenosine tetraphosphatase ApaH/serine/threonine PP2A family protein phosphatase